MCAIDISFFFFFFLHSNLYSLEQLFIMYAKMPKRNGNHSTQIQIEKQFWYELAYRQMIWQFKLTITDAVLAVQWNLSKYIANYLQSCDVRSLHLYIFTPKDAIDSISSWFYRKFSFFVANNCVAEYKFSIYLLWLEILLVFFLSESFKVYRNW